MTFVKRGRFTIESESGIGQPDQSVDIRIPYSSSQKPLVCRVQLYASPPRSDSVRHTVLIQYQSPELLALNRVPRGLVAASKRTDYLNAAFFNTKNVVPDAYSVGTVKTGRDIASSFHDIAVGEIIPRPGSDKKGETIEIRDEGGIRLFIVTSPEGSNTLAIPRDLNPYVGNNKKDLAFAVKFMAKWDIS